MKGSFFPREALISSGPQTPSGLNFENTEIAILVIYDWLISPLQNSGPSLYHLSGLIGLIGLSSAVLLHMKSHETVAIEGFYEAGPSEMSLFHILCLGDNGWKAELKKLEMIS